MTENLKPLVTDSTSIDEPVDQGGNDDHRGADEFSRDYVEKLRRENARYRTQVRELQPKAARADELEAANATELEKAVAQARAEAEQSTAQRYRALLLQAEARAIAAELKFRDTDDAVRLADLSHIEAGEDDAVDPEAVRSALRAVAEKKPYLVEGEPAAVPSPQDAGIGVNGTDAKDYGSYSVEDFDKELFGA